MKERPQVLIAGAGPAGLMMSCLLAIHQIPFRIIDKNKGPSQYSGALFIQAATMELFRQTGIIKEVLSKGVAASKINVLVNGKLVSSLNMRSMGDSLSEFPFVFMLEQSETERLLIHFIERFGHQVEWQSELTSLSFQRESVTAVILGPNRKKDEVTVPYLIGADGSHSTVRNLLNISFDGRTYRRPLFIMDLKADTLKSGEITFSFSKSAAAGFFSLPNKKLRIDGFLPKQDKDISFAEVRSRFGKELNLQLPMTDPDWFSVFVAQRHKASVYYKNRCFLLGDAARVFTPIAAQGLNTGMQDAWNLSWKLAFVLQQKASPKLLESYPTERYYLKGSVSKTSEWIYRIVTDTRVLRLIRILLLPSVVRFAFFLFRSFGGFRRSVFRSLSEIGIKYRLESCSKGKFLSSAPAPGFRMPYFSYREGPKSISFQESITCTQYHLAVFANEVNLELANIAVASGIKIHLIRDVVENKNLFLKFGIRHNGCYLVRPDLYIAFRCEGQNADALEKYMTTNFLKT